MAIPENYLGQDPEDYLPFTPPEGGIVNRFQPKQPFGQVPLTGVGKYAGQFVRGASMGLLGDPEGPQNIPQAITEMAGGTVPWALGTSLVGPIVGAAPLLRTFPVMAQRAITGGVTGAVTGAAHGKFTGGDPAQEALLGAGLGAVGELAWAAWANRAKGRSAPEQNVAAVEQKAMGALPPGPPGLGPAQGLPWGGRQAAEQARMPARMPGEPPPGVQAPPPGPRARVVSSEPIPGTEPVPGTPPGPIRGPIPLQSMIHEPPQAPGAPSTLGTPGELPMGPRTPRAIPAHMGPPEQMRLIDEGATQLQLPMNILPSNRVNRYATPTKFKGAYGTTEVATREADMIARGAIQEGVQTVRVTTTIGPDRGAPTGGLLRVYQATPTGPELVSERALNMGATRAAQVGASPMRRVSTTYFDVEYNPQLGSDILIPKDDHVTLGLQIAEGIDPHQATFPLNPEQLTFLRSYEGRGVRQTMDIRTKIPTLDDVMAMDEATAHKVLIAPEEAPPGIATGVVEATDDAIRAQSLLADLAIDENEVHAFLSTLTRRMSPRERFQRTLDWLRSKCGSQGPPSAPPAGGQ